MSSPPFPSAQARPQLVGRVFRIGLGVVAVAISAQIAIPLPFTPIPFTLQGLAVLLVGAFLGPAEGASALGAYLVLGAMGAPVFAGGTGGALRLVGPTGGYLLAFPLAAAIAGLARPARRITLGGSVRSALLLLAAMVVIHLGGASQLAILGGDPSLALQSGVVPFVAGDLLKVAIATLVLAGSNRLTAHR